LEELSTHGKLDCFLEAENRNDLEEDVLVDEAVRDEFILFWETIVEPEVEAFPCFQK